MKLEMWGGIECTVNRVNSRTYDQLARSGHDQRLDDLDRIAALGLKTLRYPVLWERVQPRGPDEYDWTWSDERLGHLRALGIRPIVGLLHHGSGPHWTDLLDPEFPSKLARYAVAVARRYPWVDAYVLVNEPLTTARFSGLYGHWYPHHTDNASFVRALLNQVEGVALSMAAIRTVCPAAELVQTEDLGKTFSTETLRYQADFENERRWITFDLLAGRFSQGHPLWDFMLESGADRGQIDRLALQPCPADIQGINYYVTSERYLDENVEAYPLDTRGGNVFHAYADVAAVRARPEGLLGLSALLQEMWARYGTTMAVTEVHIGCTREEQIRWLVDSWNQCRYLAEHGVDCRAMTAWALLGAYDWSSLVTEERGDYESGAFDLSTGKPRPTAVARTIRTLAAGMDFIAPILRVPGWWRRPERLAKNLNSPPSPAFVIPGSPILIIGAGKDLGSALGRICEDRGLACRFVTTQDMDLDAETSIRRAVKEHRPWTLVDLSNFTPSDLSDPSRFGEQLRHHVVEASGCDNLRIHCLSLSAGSDFSFGSDPYSDSVVACRANNQCLSGICHVILDLLVDEEIGRSRLDFVRL